MINSQNSENSAHEIIEDQNTDNINLKTEEMDVPHHAHHQGKKNWKSYAWEFVMLFLAVFCGFLAEYQLEHKIEEERVKKYMHDMVVNLTQDTLLSNQVINGNVYVGKGLDSLRAEIALVVKGKANHRRIYQLWLMYSAMGNVKHNKSVINQLESSGSLRLVKNDELVNKILQYYKRRVVESEYQLEETNHAIRRTNEMWYEVMDMSYFDKLVKIETNHGDINSLVMYRQACDSLFNSLPENLPLLNKEPQKLQVLYNNIVDREGHIKDYNSYLRWANDDAKKLIKQIKKEYNF